MKLQIIIKKKEEKIKEQCWQSNCCGTIGTYQPLISETGIFSRLINIYSIAPRSFVFRQLAEAIHAR